MKLFNTLSKKLEEFNPLEEGKVKMYSCGPTVYDFVHIGNLRAYTIADILHRVFLMNSYSVNLVMNITDVGHMVGDDDFGEDKLEKGARREGKNPREVALFYEQDFKKRCQEMNFLSPDVWCRASEHVSEMINLIQRLEAKGLTYMTENGVYFNVEKFPHYERLSGCCLDKQKIAVREEVVEDSLKKNPFDFRLWQLNQPNHFLQWDSPWGRGFPGWHIECSAMSMKYLGEQLDVHTGGEDLIFPHHTNEIAQVEGATEKEFVRYWVHNAYIMVDGGKMSKSLGNFYTLSDLKNKSFDPLDLRYFYLTAHYRSPLNFTWESLESSQRSLLKLRKNVSLWRRQKGGSVRKEVLDKWDNQFREMVNEDLNTPRALAVVWSLVDTEEVFSCEKLDLLSRWDRVLGLHLNSDFFQEVAGVKFYTGCLPQNEQLQQELIDLIRQREDLRTQKEFETADKIRETVRSLGFDLEDNEDGEVFVRRITREGD